MKKVNKLDYFYLTLNNGVSSIKIGEKEVPIVGIQVTPESIHEVLSGKKIERNVEKKPTGVLSYIACVPVPEGEVDALKNQLMSLTIPEKEEWEKKMKQMKEDIEDQHYLNSSFGLGDQMMRRLMINSKRSQEESK